MQTEPITLRVATGDDAPALVRLAGLDDAEGPLAGELLLAEVDGAVVAAVAMADATAQADASRPTAAVVALLRERRVQMATETTSAGGRRARLRARLRRIVRSPEGSA